MDTPPTPPVLEKRRTKPSARLRDADNDSEFQLTSHRQARTHAKSEASGKAAASGSADVPETSATVAKRKAQRTSMVDVTDEEDAESSSMCSIFFFASDLCLIWHLASAKRQKTGAGLDEPILIEVIESESDNDEVPRRTGKLPCI